jgi:hypothetical protein
VLHPASGDGGTLPADKFGAFLKSIPLRLDGATPNHVDAALVSPTTRLAASILGIGKVSGGRKRGDVRLGEDLRKVGSATGLTHGRVIGLDATILVSYAALGPDLGSGLFRDQIVTDHACRFGDSGAIAVDQRSRAVGMVYGGSRDFTILCPWHRVASALRIRLG